MRISISTGSDVLFHITGVSAAANILQKNRFELKPAEGSEWEEKMSRGKFYLSCARSMQSAYIKKSLYQYSVILKLDGRKLGQKYAIKPIDYWGSNDGENAGDKLYRRKLSNEMEDRVLSNTTFMPAVKYIAEVHVCMNDKRRTLLQIKKACLLHKIPVFFYNDSKDIALLNKAKTVPFKFSKEDLAEPEKYEYSREYRMSQYKNRKRSSSLRKWIEVYSLPIDPKLPDIYDSVKKLNKEYGKRAYDQLRYQDTINSFKADLHNAKSTPYGELTGDREYLDKVIGIMRKNRQTPEQFIDQLRNKWYPGR